MLFMHYTEVSTLLIQDVALARTNWIGNINIPLGPPCAWAALYAGKWRETDTVLSAHVLGPGPSAWWGPTAAFIPLSASPQYSEGPQWEEKFPVQYLFAASMCIPSMRASPTCVCVQTCECVCIAKANTCKSCPFHDHMSLAASTTTTWLPYWDRGRLSAIWGLFRHSVSSLPYYPISCFPRGTLSLLPSAGTMCTQTWLKTGWALVKTLVI